MTRSPIRIVHQPPLRCVLVHGGEAHVAVPLCRLLAANGAVRVVYSGDSFQGLTPLDNLRLAADPLDKLLAIEPIDAIVLLGPHSPVDCTPGAEEQIGAMLKLVPLIVDHCRRMPPDARDRLKIVQLSGDHVFGSLPTGTAAFDGHARYAPSSLRAATQAAADHLIVAAAAEHGLPVTIAHYPELYGPGVTTGLVPELISAAVARAPMKLIATGAVERDWLNAHDLAAAIVAMIWHGLPGAIYPVSARQVFSERRIAHLVADLADRLDPPIDGHRRRALMRFLPPTRPRDARRALDPSWTEASIGWRPANDFQETLRTMIDQALRADTASRTSARTSTASVISLRSLDSVECGSVSY